ncbi:AzlC family ABC transporter permease [Leeia sp.]|uniref:AzlC family ABC transporter permease n=1 Tax=Leeia sp. TaxID=2884678 RepID=UPI0035AF5DB5
MHTPRSALLEGARDTLPMLVGAAPFGVIFGTLAAGSAMQLWHGSLMSATVYAGSSQFIAVGLVAGHASLLLIWLTTFVVNLRHALYSATLLPHVAHLPLRWRAGLGALLTDETFAVMVGHYRLHPQHSQSHWYFLGSAGSMYLNWQSWTLLGVLFGAAFPALQQWGLDFAMVVTFIGIVVPQLKQRPQLLAALTAGAVALLGRHWPYKGGLMLAILAGVTVGVWVHARTSTVVQEAA